MHRHMDLLDFVFNINFHNFHIHSQTNVNIFINRLKRKIVAGREERKKKSVIRRQSKHAL